MAYTLKLEDTDGKEVEFSSICSYSSGTIKNQERRLQLPGLTLVAYIPHEMRAPFHQAIETMVKTGRRFKSFDRLHFTMLGLFAGEIWDPALLPLLTGHFKDFFGRTNLHHISVRFSLVRPGFFRGKPSCSDGTVVAMADEKSANQIIDITKRLSRYLHQNLSQSFPKPKGRPLPGVWCTLGYFDEPDFYVDEKIIDAFCSLSEFDTEVPVNMLSLTQFELKSLADGIDRALFPLYTCNDVARGRRRNHPSEDVPT